MALGLAARPGGWGYGLEPRSLGARGLITPVMQFRSQRRAMCLRGFRGLEPPGRPCHVEGPLSHFALPREAQHKALRSSGPGTSLIQPLGALAALAGAPG